MEKLLREQNAIDNSMKSAAGVLNQALIVRLELRTEGAGLKGITGTMSVIAGKTRILFTLWYLFARGGGV